MLPATVTVPGDPGAEVLVADVDDRAFARAYLDFAEVVDQVLDPDPVRSTVVAVDGGYLVTATARSYVRDLTLQVDRVDPNGTVDDALVTLLPGESAQFRVASTARVVAQELDGPLVMRHANGLLRSTVAQPGAGA
jgi:beta-mannosidase